ncbi:hypothetical protein N656DRAFT_793761 [Canariomyces notabilis]|uniref:Uncharacterized protein n=1 Tax=Canariomyces notabilis TaxID=2074819 RepID=A0AAN6TML0_9PEZI|nr:hypothetical protein N656DRAFT_793761 [Canariomyces arenarius]
MGPLPANPTRPTVTQGTFGRPGAQPAPGEEHAAAFPVVAVQALRDGRPHFAQLVAVGEELGWRGRRAEVRQRNLDAVRVPAAAGSSGGWVAGAFVASVGSCVLG